VLRVLGFPYAVVKKYGDDEGGREAALVTYYGFLSIFPLLLAVAALSRVLADHPDLRQRLITAIVPQALRSTVEHSVTTLPTSAIPFAAGLIGLLFSGTGVVLSAYQTPLVYAAEVAAVRHARLWPRALDLSRPTAADTRALALLAREQERIPAARVELLCVPRIPSTALTSRRPAAAAAAPPETELGGPGTPRDPAQRDTERPPPPATAAGQPGHDPALSPRHRPPPLGCQVHARQLRPPGDPPEHQGAGPPASPGEP
jgi:hypothetical protein